MSFRLFGRGDSCGTRIKLPDEYRTSVRWLPRLNDVFPDFVAQTTYGELRFRDWAEGAWVYLFSHSAAFSPVCSGEIVDMANRRDAFERHAVKPLLVARRSAAELTAWAEGVERIFDVQISFPMVSDPRGLLTRGANMVHPRECPNQPIRKSFLIDPQMRIRMILEYPMDIGRNVGEALRVANALKVADQNKMLVGDQTGGLCPLPAGKAKNSGQMASGSPDGAADRRRHLRVVQSRVDPPVAGTSKVDQAGD
jgi:thioredoxin-dependent peroxiredoxin